MPLIFIFVVGIAVALIRRRLLIAPEDRTGGTRRPGCWVGRLACWPPSGNSGARR